MSRRGATSRRRASGAARRRWSHVPRSRGRRQRAQLGSLFRLDGKRALIVGGYGGIGRVTPSCSCESRSRGRDRRTLARRRREELAGELEAGGHGAVGLGWTWPTGQRARGGRGGRVEQLGGLDVLVNLAGIDLEAKAEEFGEDDWRRSSTST